MVNKVMDFHLIIDKLFGNVNKTYQMVYCIKGLHKSTYKRNAFLKGHRYAIHKAEKDMVWVIDELGRPFSFTKSEDSDMYNFEEYFFIT